MPSLEDIVDSIGRAGPYKQVYVTLLESGLRLVEAVRLLREYESLVCVELNGYRRCMLWLPRLRGCRAALWAYHVTPVHPTKDLTDRRVSSYARRHKLVPPKCIRKFVATKMAELGMHPDIISYITGSTPRGTAWCWSDSFIAYADAEYKRYADWLRRVYQELGV